MITAEATPTAREMLRNDALIVAGKCDAKRFRPRAGNFDYDLAARLEYNNVACANFRGAARTRTST